LGWPDYYRAPHKDGNYLNIRRLKGKEVSHLIKRNVLLQIIDN